MLRCLWVFVVTAGFSCSVLAAGADPDLTVAPIARDGQVVVSFDLSDGFTPDVGDAIQSGLSTTFSYEVHLRRDAWFFWPWGGTAFGQAKFTFTQ